MHGNVLTATEERRKKSLPHLPWLVRTCPAFWVRNRVRWGSAKQCGNCTVLAKAHRSRKGGRLRFSCERKRGKVYESPALTVELQAQNLHFKRVSRRLVGATCCCEPTNQPPHPTRTRAKPCLWPHAKRKAPSRPRGDTAAPRHGDVSCHVASAARDWRVTLLALSGEADHAGLPVRSRDLGF